MKKLLIVLLSVISLNLLADLPTETDKLHDNYTAAIKKVVEPINLVYKGELTKLLEKYKKLNDLAEVAKINAELKSIGVEVNDVFGPVTDKNIDKLFIGRVWVSSAQAEYHFLKNGAGTRVYGKIKTAFTWRILDDNLVEVTGKFTPAAENKLWYFKFTDRKDALFGESRDNVINPLTSK